MTPPASAGDLWVVDLLPLAGWIVAAALLATLLLAALRAAWRRWVEGLRARRRVRRAARGEREAEELLEGRGYRVVERQPSLRWSVEVDGEPHEVLLRADLLVTRGGERLVAEVKTGGAAPRIETAATRRQLLEYRVAYDVDGVLLVDPEAGKVREVVFDLE